MSLAAPVGDEEFVLRHIPGGTTFQKPGPELTSYNFKPRLNETGISISRETLTTPESLMTRLGDPHAGSKIARASVAEIRGLGLEVVAVPLDYDAGHSEIRSAAASLDDKDVRRQLAKLFEFLPAPTPPPTGS
jgi:hypothetical protein